ncbi:glycosyltransferase [Priestia filamentosa]|uniref:glycosyltransferase n=1 Tax=Priestia filamentosa TaxID=1402861 RepID=UPI003982D0EE
MSKILYIVMSDIDLKNNNSGPTVRSLEILKQLKALHRDVDVIMAKNSKERWQQFKLLDKDNVYDFCYIESKVGVTRYYDTLLLLFLKKKFRNLIVGLYYRDMYWKYGIQVSKGVIKNLFVPFVNKCYLKLLGNICDVIFGQSGDFCKSMEGIVSDKCELEILPPGCEEVQELQKEAFGVIYVGEIDSVFSGVELLIDSMRLVNHKQKVPLYLVCRKHEYDENTFLREANYKYEWLNIEHHTKETIGEVYSKANLAMIPRYKSEYTKLCMPIKLFESISYELPIVAVQHGETTRFIEESNIGLITNTNPNQIADSILRLISDRDLRGEMIDNLKIAKEKNSWTNRVREISRVLGKVH